MSFSIKENFPTVENPDLDVKVQLTTYGDSERVRIFIRDIPVLMIHPQDVDKLVGMLQAVKRRAGK